MTTNRPPNLAEYRPVAVSRFSLWPRVDRFDQGCGPAPIGLATTLRTLYKPKADATALVTGSGDGGTLCGTGGSTFSGTGTCGGTGTVAFPPKGSATSTGFVDPTDS